MDEDIAIINRETRIKKIKDFFFNNKKIIIVLLSIIIILIFAYFIFQDINKKNKIKLSNQFNKAIISFSIENKKNTEEELIKIINKKDITYSPLALYFLIDNNIIKENSKVNGLFDILINETKLEKEIKNLIIYKKALFNSNFETENNLIEMLSPIINSESIWKSHGLYLMAEYFYSKNEIQKSKDFFDQIVILENANPKIKIEAQKKLNRDFSE
tara:strand:+ start:668 stop:1312 length:645 start_codon:yes stop_codon:yes gene_type:complete